MTRSKTSPFWALAVVAALGMGLAGCGSNGDDDTAEAPVVEPTPTPEPAPPSDLAKAQDAAKMAAAAAKAASDAADGNADAAEAATATLATLQTGEKARAAAEGARSYADKAMAEYMKAKAASDAAAAATDAGVAGESVAAAKAAQAAAEGHAGMAADYGKKAGDYAGMELHIVGTVKSVGGSSLDASSGELRTPTAGGGVMITGTLLGEEIVRTTAGKAGVPFARRTTDGGKDTSYEQAVAAGSIQIGKVVDTSDDTARLTIITAREGTKKVRVFVDGAVDAVTGLVGAATAATSDAAETGGALDDGATAKSIGMYYRAKHYSDANTADATDTNLGAHDRVAVTKAKGIEIFELSKDDAKAYARRVDSTTNVATGGTTHTYRVVDISADASLPDGLDINTDLDNLSPVTASIPVAADYSHVHFGVWAGLGKAKKDGSQTIADLGIGFVQNFSGSGVTTANVTGTATFQGNWVGVVRERDTGVHMPGNGDATLTANFSKDEFTADLKELAKLNGSLLGNEFSGNKASVSHSNLDASGDFDGSFSGALYGDKGEEAAGVFSFDGGEAGAFVGAFGGRDVDQK